MIKKSDWTRAFCEPEFSQISGFHRKIENHKIFILDYFQLKLISKFSKSSKKWVHFAQFRKNTNFPKNLAPSIFSLYGSLTSRIISRKTNLWIPRKMYSQGQRNKWTANLTDKLIEDPDL